MKAVYVDGNKTTDGLINCSSVAMEWGDSGVNKFWNQCHNYEVKSAWVMGERARTNSIVSSPSLTGTSARVVVHNSKSVFSPLDVLHDASHNFSRRYKCCQTELSPRSRFKKSIQTQNQCF